MMKVLLRVSVFFAMLFGSCLFQVKQGVAVEEIPDILANKNISWGSHYGFVNPGDKNFNPIDGLFESSGTTNDMLTTSHEVGALLTGRNSSSDGSGMIKSKANNLLDLRNKFTIKTMVNMYNPGGVNDAADGVAFFMTGDPNANLGGRSGERLGIWGEWEKYDSPNADPSATAMQESFVVALNAYVKPSEKDSINKPIGGGSNVFRQYIAHGYPAQSDTYTNGGRTGIPGFYRYFYTLQFDENHTNFRHKIVQGLLSNSWVPLTIEYTPGLGGGGTLNYSYGKLAASEITWTEADLDKYFGTGNRLLYWGFTGTSSNNKRSINSAVIFQEITGTVKASAEAYVSGITGSTVHVGDTLTQEYKITYDGSSRQSWSISGNFEVRLTTGKNYAFVVNSEGTVDVEFGTQTFKAIKKENDDRSIYFFPVGLQATPAPPTDPPTESSTVWTFTAKIKAVDDDTTINSDGSSAISGDNGGIETVLKFPVPQQLKYGLLKVPDLVFNPVTMAQVFTGIKTDLIDETSAKIEAENNQDNRKMRLTAELNTFVLNDNYESGGVQISLKAGDDEKLITLIDDSNPVQIVEDLGSQDTKINLYLSEVCLHIDPTFHINADEYNAAITWTVHDTP